VVRECGVPVAFIDLSSEPLGGNSLSSGVMGCCLQGCDGAPAGREHGRRPGNGPGSDSSGYMLLCSRRGAKFDGVKTCVVWW
jgi:hypothetical protein